MSRTANSAKNTLSGVVFRIVTLILHFATRTVFVRYLGNEILSVNGLVSSILSFLNVAELGIGTALVFAMYRPIAEEDEEKVKQYLYFYKRIYAALGATVLALGVLLFPLYYVLISKEADAMAAVNVVVVYLIQLAQSVLSFYFFINRGGFLSATQQDYRLTLSNCLTSIATSVLQVVAIAVFHNYYIYIAIPMAAMVVQRTVNGLMIGKWFPYIREKPTGSLSKEEKHAVVRNTFGLAISKICTIINNAVANIVITAVVSLAAVGHFSNYQTVMVMLSGTVSILFSAMLPSVGNLSATGSIEDKKRVFRLIYFVAFWIYGFSAISYVTIIEPFVTVWVGAQYVMPLSLAIAMSVNFLIGGMDVAISTFREGCGLYYEGRYRPIFTTALNILLALLFGTLWDVTGIVVANMASRLLTIWWFDAYLVHSRVFHESPVPYLLNYIGRVAVVGAVGVFVLWLCSFITVESAVLEVLIRAGICTVVINAFLLLIYGRTREFRSLLEIVKNLLRRRRKT